MSNDPVRGRADPNVRATLFTLAGTIASVLAVLGLVAWAAMITGPTEAGATIASTGALTIGVIGAVSGAAMTAVGIALRRRSSSPSTSSPERRPE